MIIEINENDIKIDEHTLDFDVYWKAIQDNLCEYYSTTHSKEYIKKFMLENLDEIIRSYIKAAKYFSEHNINWKENFKKDGDLCTGIIICLDMMFE